MKNNLEESNRILKNAQKVTFFTFVSRIFGAVRDLVIANFYPFEKIIKQNKNHKIIIENIDIGGPTLVRAAAKNYEDVAVITKIEHYQKLVDELDPSDTSSDAMNARGAVISHADWISTNFQREKQKIAWKEFFNE